MLISTLHYVASRKHSTFVPNLVAVSIDTGIIVVPEAVFLLLVSEPCTPD
jgi:hypothetical protein